MKRIYSFTISIILMFLFLCSGPMAQTEEPAKRNLNPYMQDFELISPGQAEISAVNHLEQVNNGYRLQNPQHTAIFSSEGFFFKPLHDGPYWHWQLTHLGDEETASIEVDSGRLKPDNQKPGVVSYMRGSIKEQYLMRQKSIEQQFVIPEPLNLSGKDLVIEGRVRSTGTFKETEKGWLWVSNKGVVSLGHVYVYDAEGKRIAASMKATAESTRIRVDGRALALANYPVTVDPEVGTNDFRISDMGSTDGNTNYGAHNPAVAYNSTNNEYLVVWEGDDDTGSLVDGEFEIFGQRINAVTGDEVGTDFRISDMGSTDGNTDYGAHNPSVAYNSTNNEYLVVWEGDDNTSPLVDDEFEIFGQRINAATGAEVGTNDFRISDMGPNGNTSYEAYKPDVSYNSTNNVYLVIWEGDDNTSPLVDGEFEIFGQRINAATGGEVGTNDFRVSDMGPNGNTSYEAKSPAVAYNSTNNEYLVVWHGDDNTGSLVDGEYEIYYQRLNAATGAEVGTNDFRVSDMGGTGDTTYNAYKPDVAYNSSYNVYMVVWEGDDDPVAQPGFADDEYEIYHQLLNAATGSEVGINDFRISSAGPNGDSDYDAYDASVAYNNIEDEYLVVWSATDWSPLLLGEFEIHAQRHRGSDGWETPPYDFRLSDMDGLSNIIFDAYNPAIAFSSTEHQFLIIWEGDDNTGSLADDEFEIFGQQWELSSLSTSAVVGSPFYVTPVADAAVGVPYTIPTGAYYPGNVFTAYLSDSSGDFSSETAIGTRVATDEGSINALIPAGTGTGSGYRIRVKSSDPPVTAPDNGSDLTIVLFTNSIAPTTTQNISAGTDGTTLAVSESPAADSRQWKYSTISGGPYTNDIAGATATTYTPNFAGVGTYYVVCASTKGLATVISNEVQINVLVQTISTGTITGSPFFVSLLQNASVSVPYTITGSFNPGNVFTAYLSDASGSFASGIAIGSRTAIDGGTISALIPAGTATGSGYRIKIESNNPPLTGSNNGSDLTIILFTNSIAPTATQNISIGVDGATLSVTESPAADSRQWKYSTTSGGPYTNDIAGATATTYTPNFASIDTYYVICASTKGLLTIMSNEVLINVGVPPTISITNPQADAYVRGTVALQASADDDVGISLVEFFIDDIKIGDGIVTAPYPYDNRENAVRGIPIFDFSRATTVFINSGNRLRKIDAFGNITKVIDEDNEVQYLQKNPQGKLIILFAEPQLLDDGNHYSLIMADPQDNTLEGIDKYTSSLVYDFPRTGGIQFDENENMFFISSQVDGSISIRKYIEKNRTETLFRGNIIIRDWVVKPDSTVIIGAEGFSRRMERLIVISPDNEITWFQDPSDGSERRVDLPEEEDYTDLFREKGDRFWNLFRHSERDRTFVSSEVAEAGFIDSIHQMKHSSGRIYIAGNKNGINRLIVCDPSKNSLRDLLYDNIKIAHLDVLENGDVYFSGYSPGENKYLAAVLEYNDSGWDSGDYSYKELAMFMDEPSGFAALEPHGSLFDTDRESENHRAINAIHTLNWDTSFYSAGSYELKAVAHDTDGLTAEDSINVNVVKLNITLSASRDIEQAWIIRKEYAKLEIDVENTDVIPVSKYVIYRKEAGQSYSTLEEIPGSEIQDGLYTFYDIDIEKDVTYTYRVAALDATGTVIGLSEEKVI